MNTDVAHPLFVDLYELTMVDAYVRTGMADRSATEGLRCSPVSRSSRSTPPSPRGAELHPGLDVDGPVIRKGTGGEDGYSGFTARDVTTGTDRPTGLADVLRDRGVERVVVVGLAQDVCVKETALDARRLGLDTVVDLAATRAVNVHPGDDERANRELTDAGVELRS